MSEEIKLNPKISNIQTKDGELHFILSGSDEYGLDKSLVNALRRVLLTEIPTVAFRVDDNNIKNKNDLIMVTNNT